MSIPICAVCGVQVEQIIHHFPTRKYPNNASYFASLYHRDPFLGKGEFEEYCGPKCATEAFSKNI
jgi:hypothetical protein